MFGLAPSTPPNMLQSIVKRYVHLLKTYPACTKITSGAILVGVGDILAQLAIEKQNWDRQRTLRFAGIAFLVVTPMTRTWVDVILPKLAPVSGNISFGLAMKKLLLDMVLFGPVVSSAMVGLNMWFSGHVSKSEFVEKMKSEQPGIIKTAWGYWGPVQFVNFRFVPMHLQASFIQVMALFWNTFLSWKAHDNLMKDEKEK